VQEAGGMLYMDRRSTIDSYSNTLSVTCYWNKIACQKKAKNKTAILMALSRRRLQRCKRDFLLCTSRLQSNLQQQPNGCKTRGWNVLFIMVETSKDPIHLDFMPFLAFSLFITCESYILLSQLHKPGPAQNASTS
jgi:hypothetical protein